MRNDDIIYLSHFIDAETPTYGNRTIIKIDQTSSIKDGDTANSFSFSTSSNHIGTHIDLPSHFFDSEKNVSFYNPNAWIFNKIGLIDIQILSSKLIDLDADELNLDYKIDLLLIRTGYEQFRNEDKYWNNYPGFKLSFIKKIKNKYKNLRAIGFDFISLTSPINKEEGKKCHLELLNPDKEIFIIEDMKLSNVKNKIKNVTIAPWQINRMDSAPVTIIAEIE